MAGVISAAQVQAWFNASCSLADTWETWHHVWSIDGLNDTDPPPPPQGPMSPTQRKVAFCDAIAEAYSGPNPPAGWPY